MFVVVAGTIRAPVSPSLIGTATEAPLNTSPLVGERISSFAGLLGRGEGGELGPPELAAFEQATIRMAGMAMTRIARLVRVMVSLLPFT
jgi:hypothetical protein